MINRKQKVMVQAILFVFVYSTFYFGGQPFQGQATKHKKAIFGYLPISGSWVNDDHGLIRGSSDKKQPGLILSSTEVGHYFVYESNVKIKSSSKNTTGSLVFRANDMGTEGYMLTLEPTKSRVQLVDMNSGKVIGKPIKKQMKKGVSYKVKIIADGPLIRVFLNNDIVIDIKDLKNSKGVTGFHVEDGTTEFSEVLVHEVKTNLTEWEMQAQWKASPQGLAGHASSKENIKAISNTMVTDFNYEANVIINDKSGTGTLLFRTDKTGMKGYGLQIDAKKDLIRLIEMKHNKVIVENNMPIQSGTLYHIRVKAEGNSLKVFWQNSSEPIMTAQDHAYEKGFLGLHVYNGNVVFQNIQVSNLSTNLDGWNSYNGDWLPHLEGIMGSRHGADNTYRMAEATEGDFILEGDLKVDPSTPYGTAGFVFRANSDVTKGYMVKIDPNLNQVRLLDLSGDRIVGIADRNIETGKTYHFEIHAKRSAIKVFLDGYAEPVIDVQDTAYSSGKFGLNVYNGTAYFQHVYATQFNEYYEELYRPQYHFTQARGSASDPNGLVYYEGEYHLFHQDGGKWAHAVSPDLVHWKRLPIAIPWNEMGHAWSGSAVVDRNNVSGLFNEEGSGLIAFYTSFNPAKHNGDQKVGVAYSSDKGRTWEFYDGNPIIPNIGEFYGGEGWDFRDPKVVWDEDHKLWVMVISGGDHIRFFTSKDLLNWEMIESFGYGNYVRGGVWECPNFFQLPVDGDEKRKKWVLSISTGANPNTNGSDSEYFIGTFDGKRFVSDHPAGVVLKNEYGKEMYAAMSFSDIPESDVRRISLGWMSNWDYPFSFPTNPWQGQMSIPREVTLKTVQGEGIRLFQQPVEELVQLRGLVSSWSNKLVKPKDQNLLSEISGTAYEIIAEFELPENNQAEEFGLQLRKSETQQTVVGYNVSNSKMFFDRSNSGEVNFSEKFSTLHETNVNLENNRIKMRMYVDKSSVEVFVNNGQAVFTNVIFPDGASNGMSLYTKGGNVKIVSLEVYPLKGIWKDPSNSGELTNKIVMDHQKLELRVGETHKLSAVSLPQSAKNQRLKWTSSNPSIVKIKTIDNNNAEIKVVGHGRGMITATTTNGKVVGTTVVDSKAFFNIVDVNSGKALTVEGTSNGSKVQIKRKKDGLEQLWNIERNESGSHKVVSTNSNKVLDASGISNGDDVQIWEYFGYGNQQWLLTHNGDGTFTFNVVNSGKALEVPQNSDDDGTIVEINERNFEAAQKWKLIEANFPLKEEK